MYKWPLHSALIFEMDSGLNQKYWGGSQKCVTTTKSEQPNNINGQENSFCKSNKGLWFSKAGHSKHVCIASWFLGHKHPEFSESPITALLIFLKFIHYIESLVSNHSSLSITFSNSYSLSKPQSKFSSSEPKVLHFSFHYSIITFLHACYNTLLHFFLFDLMIAYLAGI